MWPCLFCIRHCNLLMKGHHGNCLKHNLLVHLFPTLPRHRHMHDLCRKYCNEIDEFRSQLIGFLFPSPDPPMVNQVSVLPIGSSAAAIAPNMLVATSIDAMYVWTNWCKASTTDSTSLLLWACQHAGCGDIAPRWYLASESRASLQMLVDRVAYK